MQGFADGHGDLAGPDPAFARDFQFSQTMNTDWDGVGAEALP